MRVVLDSNVILAAFVARGLCEAVLEASVAGREMYTSAALLEEITRHLSGKFKLPASRVKEIADFISTEFEFVEPVKVEDDACRDKNDWVVLGTAVAAGADCLVTGDKDLLVLNKYGSVLILSPRAFYDRLK